MIKLVFIRQFLLINKIFIQWRIIYLKNRIYFSKFKQKDR